MSRPRSRLAAPRVVSEFCATVYPYFPDIFLTVGADNSVRQVACFVLRSLTFAFSINLSRFEHLDPLRKPYMIQYGTIVTFFLLKMLGSQRCACMLESDPFNALLRVNRTQSANYASTPSKSQSAILCERTYGCAVLVGYLPFF
jgi:hypothetical protein